MLSGAHLSAQTLVQGHSYPLEEAGLMSPLSKLYAVNTYLLGTPFHARNRDATTDKAGTSSGSEERPISLKGETDLEGTA